MRDGGVSNPTLFVSGVGGVVLIAAVAVGPALVGKRGGSYAVISREPLTRGNQEQGGVMSTSTREKLRVERRQQMRGPAAFAGLGMGIGLVLGYSVSTVTGEATAGPGWLYVLVALALGIVGTSLFQLFSRGKQVTGQDSGAEQGH